MKSYIYILTFLLAFTTSVPLEAKKLGEHSLYSLLTADSIVATILPEGIFYSSGIQRYQFDERKEGSVEFTIRDSVQITSILESFKKCDIVSKLAYPTDVVVQRMIIHHEKKYWTFWIADDKIDIHCRLLIFRKNKVLVAWLSDTGVFDFDTVRCENGKEVMWLLRDFAREARK